MSFQERSITTIKALFDDGGPIGAINTTVWESPSKVIFRNYHLKNKT